MQQALSEEGLIVFFKEYEAIRERWLLSSQKIHDYLDLELVAGFEKGKLYRIK